LATTEPATIHGVAATGIDLSAMLSHILQSPELFDKAAAELHTIAAKIPIQESVLKAKTARHPPKPRVIGQNFVSLEPLAGPSGKSVPATNTSIYEENDIAAETRVGYLYASLIHA
jgi:hypothetical protein